MSRPFAIPQTGVRTRIFWRRPGGRDCTAKSARHPDDRTNGRSPGHRQAGLFITFLYRKAFFYD